MHRLLACVQGGAQLSGGWDKPGHDGVGEYDWNGFSRRPAVLEALQPHRSPPALLAAQAAIVPLSPIT
jgi:hypothetical protein